MPNLINFGGGASEGTAKAEDVLVGKTFSNDDNTGIAGSMANKGSISVSGNGNTNVHGFVENVNSGPAYNDGVRAADARVNTNSKSYSQGVSDADGRANTNSTNYKTGYNNGRIEGRNDVKNNPGGYGLESGGSYNNGYNKGVSDADNRANSNSQNYKSGYNSGYSKGVSDADGRANSNSANYKAGYDVGKAQPKSQAHSFYYHFKSASNRLDIYCDGVMILRAWDAFSGGEFNGSFENGTVVITNT